MMIKQLEALLMQKLSAASFFFREEAVRNSLSAQPTFKNTHCFLREHRVVKSDFNSSFIQAVNLMVLFVIYHRRQQLLLFSLWQVIVMYFWDIL